MLNTIEHYERRFQHVLMDKEEIVRHHTIETGELRKRNAALEEQAQKAESYAMSAVPTQTEFSTDFSDFDHLTTDSSPWDMLSGQEFGMDTHSHQETALAVKPKSERHAKEEKSSAPGLLLMLLLCGAWVASKNSTAAIPQMSDDVRVASATVLDDIYREAGLESQTGASTHVNRMGGHYPKTSIMPAPNTFPQPPMTSLHHQLTAPSEEQQRQQVFSLSANQYNAITSDDTYDDSQASMPHRRNIQQELAAMRRDKHDSATEVYTRSLLRDQVPTNIVRDFARMVAEHNQGHFKQENREPMS